MQPKIALSITDRESNAQLKNLGVDFLELRVDLFKGVIASGPRLKPTPECFCRGHSGVNFSDEAILYARRQLQNRRKLRVPLILTVRNQKQEGARRAFPDAKKWALMQALMPLAQWVDIELSSPVCAKVLGLARQQRKKTILSVHDFQSMPGNAKLEQILRKAMSLRPDVVKIAAKANAVEDLLRLVEFTRKHRRQPLVTMCLGPWGSLSRLILPACGSRWVYTFLSQPTASGQLDLKTLQHHLRVNHPR